MGTSPRPTGFNFGPVSGCGPASHVDLVGGIAIVVLSCGGCAWILARIGVRGRPSTERVTRRSGLPVMPAA